MKTFDKIFTETLDSLETEAKDNGLNFTSICRETGISRATPDRWKRKPPKTVQLVVEMQRTIERRKKALGNQIPGEEP